MLVHLRAQPGYVPLGLVLGPTRHRARSRACNSCCCHVASALSASWTSYGVIGAVGAAVVAAAAGVTIVPEPSFASIMPPMASSSSVSPGQNSGSCSSLVVVPSPSCRSHLRLGFRSHGRPGRLHLSSEQAVDRPQNLLHHRLVVARLAITAAAAAAVTVPGLLDPDPDSPEISSFLDFFFLFPLLDPDP